MEWRTIDSAPKDGRLIRLKLSNGHEVDGENWGVGWAYDGLAAFLSDDMDVLDADPTHWAPIDPPKEK